MSEEKKLDEKTLEGVTGGVSFKSYDTFITVNCSSCHHYYHPTCPYGRVAWARQEVGSDGLCPKKETWK